MDLELFVFCVDFRAQRPQSAEASFSQDLVDLRKWISCLAAIAFLVFLHPPLGIQALQTQAVVSKRPCKIDQTARVGLWGPRWPPKGFRQGDSTTESYSTCCVVMSCCDCCVEILFLLFCLNSMRHA